MKKLDPKYKNRIDWFICWVKKIAFIIKEILN